MKTEYRVISCDRFGWFQYGRVDSASEALTQYREILDWAGTTAEQRANLRIMALVPRDVTAELTAQAI